MIHMQEFNSGFQDTFGLEQSMPLIQAFDYITNQMNDQNTMIGRLQEEFTEYKQAETDRKLEIKKDLLVELATKADIEKFYGIIKIDIEKLHGRITSENEKLHGRITSVIEKLNGRITSEIEKLNGKITSENEKLNGRITSENEKINGKIEKLNGRITSEIEKLNGIIKTNNEKLSGKIDSLQLWMKMLVGVAILAVTCYSPMAQELIKLIKF